MLFIIENEPQQHHEKISFHINVIVLICDVVVTMSGTTKHFSIQQHSWMLNRRKFPSLLSTIRVVRNAYKCQRWKLDVLLFCSVVHYATNTTTTSNSRNRILMTMFSVVSVCFFECDRWRYAIVIWHYCRDESLKVISEGSMGSIKAKHCKSCQNSRRLLKRELYLQMKFIWAELVYTS